MRCSTGPGTSTRLDCGDNSASDNSGPVLRRLQICARPSRVASRESVASRVAYSCRRPRSAVSAQCGRSSPRASQSHLPIRRHPSIGRARSAGRSVGWSAGRGRGRPGQVRPRRRDTTVQAGSRDRQSHVIELPVSGGCSPGPTARTSLRRYSPKVNGP